MCSVEGCERKSVARAYCSKHYKRFMATGDALTPSAQDIQPAPDGFRVCSKCAETKELTSSFQPSSRSAGGYLRQCKSCVQGHHTAWIERDPEHAKKLQRRYAVRAAYGERGIQMLERIEAGEGCDSCGEVSPRMAIDHDHETVFVRGILCSNCNTALGLLGEDITKMVNLIDYFLLDRHEEALEAAHAAR